MVKSQQLLNDYDNTIANNNSSIHMDIDDMSSELICGRNSSGHLRKNNDTFFIVSNVNDYSSSEDDDKSNSNNDSSEDDCYESDDDSSSSSEDNDDLTSSSRVSSSDDEMSTLLFEQRYMNNNNRSNSNRSNNNISSNTTMYTRKMKKKQLENKMVRQQLRTKRDAKINLEKELLSISYIETIRLRQWRVVAIISIVLLGLICTTLIHILLVGNNNSINRDSPFSKEQENFEKDVKSIQDLCSYRWMVLQQSIESFATTVPNIVVHSLDGQFSSLTKTPSTASNLKSTSWTTKMFTKAATTTTTTTLADTSTSTFPNVIIPHYEFYANHARSISGNVLDSISFIPLLYNNNNSNNATEQHLTDWNTFSQEYYQQMIKDIIKDLSSSNTTYNKTTMDELLLRNNVLGHPTIWSYDEYNNNNHDRSVNPTQHQNTHVSSIGNSSRIKYSGPIWQISPLTATTSSDVLNFDLFSLNHISLLLDTIMSQNQQPTTTTSGLISAVTTNLGPLYCMSTNTDCMRFTEQQQYELILQEQIVTHTNNNSSSGNNNNNNDNAALDTNDDLQHLIQYENVFGASERNLPRSLYLHPIYENINEVVPNTVPPTNLHTYKTNESSWEFNTTALVDNNITSVTTPDNTNASSSIAGNVSNKNLTSRIRQLQAEQRIQKNGTELNRLPVGVVASIIVWDKFLESISTLELQSSIFAVLKNTCGQSFTYNISGGYVAFVGPADVHDDVSYNDTEYIITLGIQSNAVGQCSYSLYLYAAQQQLLLPDQMTERGIDWISLGIAILFMIILYVFCLFDTYVSLRNAKVMNVASRGERILATLFPKQVRDRIFEEDDKAATTGTSMKNDLQLPEQLYHAPTMCVQTMLSSGPTKHKQGHPTSIDGGEMSGDELQEFLYKSKPIADLFPETTILFADIAGFTAWSSVREPSQVFILLETLYGAFDNIAKRRKVFKVETVGDCYVAACGLPEPCEEHAVVMARFARLCMEQMHRIVRALERSLGPDTAELAMRAGMHSGQVTAGVLRGERSRFQLFGDTMNTAARMEQSGVKNRIQVTEETYRLLCAHGKARWLVPRADKVSPKGKGEMTTYWLKPSRQFGDSLLSISNSQSSSGLSVGNTAEISKVKLARLVDWNVQVFEELLKRIVARREVCHKLDTTPPNENHFMNTSISAIEEVREIINLPRFDDRTLKKQRDPESIHLPQPVIEQLHQFVHNIASMYRDNPFHNFEHASHVLMSVYKLLNRIIAPDITFGLNRNNELDGIDTKSNDSNNTPTKAFRRSFGRKDIDAAILHDHTYGITSDPLTQFACVLSALIHDCDHPGVPNAQLIKENATVAIQYNQKSCAEQNSIDLAWALLMSNDYSDLRNVIYQTDAELKRFRELVVNSVMATDIADKDLKALRNRRWDIAFNILQDVASSKLDVVNRKATIVIEHLIQASDVSHTMQHWHVYRKWNERFFMECYEAFVNDRAEKDPAEYWYQGEIGFFDFYIIPLAKKLKDCGVFGISSDECLNNAVKNKQEWEQRGVEIVNELVEKAKRQYF